MFVPGMFVSHLGALCMQVADTAFGGDDPTWWQASRGPEAQQWDDGLSSEMDNLERHKAYQEVPEDTLADWDPKKRRAPSVVPTQLVCKRKRGADNIVARWKVRCVVCGNRMSKALATFAPAVRHTTFKLQLAIAAMRSRRCRSLDFEAAYLQGKFDDGEVVHVRPPPGRRKHDQRGVPVIWRLLVPLYGESDAGRIWHRTLHRQMMTQKFTQSDYDPCYYFKKLSDGTQLDMLFYVDDGWCTDDHSPAADAELATLAAALKLTIAPGLPEYYLGLNVAFPSPGTVTLSCGTYIRRMCEKLLPSGRNADSYARVETPSTDALSKHYETALLREHNVCPELQKRYATKVGSLIYASPCCRPDIAITVGLLARCLTFPTPELEADADRCVVYLGQHPDDGLRFSREAPDPGTLWARCDSDWALAHSTSGWHVSLAGGLVGYGAKRQHCIALSSTEAEIMAASQLATELVYFRGLMSEVGLPQLAPTHIGCDNDGARELSLDRKSCHRSRHLTRRVFKVRELTALLEVRVERIPTADNTADIFTKPLAPASFLKHKGALMFRANARSSAAAAVRARVHFDSTVVAGRARTQSARKLYQRGRRNGV